MNQQLPSNVPAQHMRIRQKKQDDWKTLKSK